MTSVPPRSNFPILAMLLLVVAAAAGARVWYVLACAGEAEDQAPLLAQDRPAPTPLLGDPDRNNELNDLVYNLRKDRRFKGWAPLSENEEETAYVAPAYPWLVALVGNFLDKPWEAVRWAQCVLGALTAGLYFLFARRAFGSLAAAGLAGLLCAVHPFWIINAAQMGDGVLATFLLALCLLLGTRAAQTSEILTSLLYGLALAGLVLTRAALLPFAVAALLWFLLRCRRLKRGWLCALLGFLGFANGVAPWAVRDYQTFHDAVPIADSMWLHLWMGNNSLASGGPQSEDTLRKALPPERLKELLAAPTQDKRYNMLARDVAEAVVEDPVGTVRRRLAAAQYFVLGQAWYGAGTPGRVLSASEQLPDWLEDSYPVIVQATLLVLVLLGLLGWRWTYLWRRQSRLAALAAIWVPLPYVLSHAEWLWGPRLPLDGVLICYVAFALVALLPRSGLTAGPPAR